jgi:hypothetical protein
MPFVEKRLISPTSLTTSASTALYTVPTGYTAIVKQIVVTNTTGTAATFTMYIGAASAGNALFSGTSVAANDTVIINLSQVLGTGEILRALSGTNAALNLTVSGVENDGPLAQNAMYIADNAITSAKIADGAIVNADINVSAAIELSKLATSTAGNVIVYNSSGVPTAVAETGDVTISDTGVTAIKSNVSLTGVPLAPTANSTTNNTQIATTAFVTTAVSNIRVGAVPNFLVYLSGGNGSAANGATIAYNTEVYDDTNNVVSGVFTVPSGQAGVYIFTSHQNAYNIGTSGIIRGRIDITGTGIAGAYIGSSAPANGGADTYVEVSLVIKMAAGDTARCVWSVPATGNFSAGLGYNSFSGSRIA